MAEVPYDDIFLNVTSTFHKKGVENAVNALKGLQSITELSGLKQAGQDLKSFIDALDGISNNRMKAVSNLANAIKSLGGATKTLKAVQGVTETVNPLNDRSSSEAPVPVVDNSSTIKKNMQGATESAKEFKKEIEKTQSPLAKLANRFKSFLQYRAMRAIWSGFINGAKEGLKNLEDWDRNIGHTGFADSMDRARASLMMLKNALAVITAPALEWLIGILQRIASLAVVGANALSRLFAIIGGKSTYRAVKSIDAIATSEKNAGGSAKKATAEFKKQLMAFDEINNITAQNDVGSGGGGGGGAGISATDMFEELDVGELNKAEEFLGKVGEAVRKYNEELATYGSNIQETSDKFNKALNIDGIMAKIQGAMAKYNSELGKYGSDLQEKADKFNKALKIDGIVEFIRKAYVKFIGGIKDAFEGMIVYSKASKDIAIAYAEALVDGMKLAFDTLKVFLQGGDWKKYWTDGINQIKSDLDNKVTSAVDKARESVEKTFNKKYALNFDEGSANKVKEGIEKGMVTPANNFKTAMDNAKNSIDKIAGKTFNVTINTKENVTRTVSEVVARTGGVGSKTTYREYASGGYPTTGQLFIAREAGAEMVGQIGGHTAVANNQDIVNAVSQGVASAVASVMGGGSNVTVTLEGDAKGIFKVVQKEGRAYSARTGQPALA